ncbi:hypothetical protein [Halorubellus salinus]|uniref:hypothetical protein n=1 Tax=Halorubellus salinus TaxID=755309 RepID=UPI001D07E1A7|nr:hypothetical protein [Halorubellus salinus]
MANDDLHKPLKAINQTVARLREDVQSLTGEVKKIRDAIVESAERIQDAIQENIQAQAELKLMEQVMEVKSVKPQIEAEHEQIRSERDELDGRLESLNDRYADKHGELDETASERIRNLGSHIFAIDEEEFEDGIERPFTDQVTGAWGFLQEHNETVGDDRQTAVRETAGETVQAINDYIDRQDHLLERIDDHRLDLDADALPSDEPTTLQAPYFVVEYEHDGVRSRETVVPSRLDTTASEWCSAALAPMDGAESLLRGVSGVESPAETSRVQAGDVTSKLDDYADKSVLGLSYTDAVSDAVPDDGVRVAKEVSD